MQVGELYLGVPEWRCAVRVNGVERKAESVSWDGEISSDLPDAVAGVSGVTARTGTIRWAPQSAVQESPDSPWQRRASWPPKPGDRVEVWAGDQGTSWRVFTGRIDSSDGTDETLSSKIVDDYDRLSKLVSIEPVAELMPAKQATETENWPPATTGIEPWHVAYRAMRAAGYGLAVPQYSAGTRLIEAELQGSYAPTLGRLQAAGPQSSTLAWADGYTYLADGSVRYWPNEVPAPLDSATGVRMWIRWHGNRAVVTTRFTNGHSTSITVVRADTGVELTYNYWQNGTITHENKFILPMSTALQWVEVWVAPNQQMRVAYPRAATEPGTQNTALAESFNVARTPGTGVVIEDVLVNAFTIAMQVGTISLEAWGSQTSSVSGSRVRAWGRGLSTGMGSSITISQQKAIDVLEDVARKTLTGIWFDEHGVLNWAPTNTLHEQQPVRTVTTAQDIFSLGWMDSLLTVRSQIRVDYRETALAIGRRNEVVLHQATSKSRLEAGENLEEFVGPDSDHVWLEPDMQLKRAQDHLVRFNSGWDSYYGASYRAGTGGGETYHWESWMAQSVTEIEPDKWRVKIVNNSGRSVSLEVPEFEPETFGRWQGMALPIIRGRGLVSFTDAKVSINTGAASWAPALDHDLGVYGKKLDAERIRDWLSARLRDGIIKLTDLEIAYDPRLQLGDVITVESMTFFGFTVDALVIGKSESFDTAGAHMTLTVRVIRTRSIHATYSDFEAAYSGKTYAALGSAWAGSTYEDLEANPLGKA